VKELTKTQAQKKADVYRKESNTLRPVASDTSHTVDTSLTVAELIEHYKDRELGEKAGKSAKLVKAYLNIFANYICPKWGDLSEGCKGCGRRGLAEDIPSCKRIQS